MAKLIQAEAVAREKVVCTGVGREEGEPEEVGSQAAAFSPTLTLGVLTSRWLRSWATPCHARGASL